MAKMTTAEREAFLAEVRVGVLSIAEQGRGPLTVPIWYGYEPGGEVWLWMEHNSKKAQLLRAAGRASLCVQQETLPYKYVSIEGPVSAVTAATPNEVRALAQRYLPEADAEAYLASIGLATIGDSDIIVRLRPERWLTMDFGQDE
jgi:nitroimidazol reductase NimA-like FMN-containing flavoprotein (pyridoxamine 5'-phosphate oxidase superfamily)